MPLPLNLENRCLMISTRVTVDIEKIVDYIKKGLDLNELGLYLETNDFGDYQVYLDENCFTYTALYFNSQGKIVGGKYYAK